MPITHQPIPAAIRQIESAPTPMRRGSLRGAPRKTIAAFVRELLRDLGIRGVSVTTPRYSMAQGIDIRVPAVEHAAGYGPHHELGACPLCQRGIRAQRRVEALILAAYPDLGDRSDSMTDHFDYVLSVRGA